MTSCTWIENSQGEWFAECQDHGQEPIWFEDAQPQEFKFCPHCGLEIDCTEFDDSCMVDTGGNPFAQDGYV